MPLQDRISEDLKDAMRQKDELRRSTLRMIRSAIQYEEINEKKALSDAATIDILSRMARQHQESIAEYKRGGRHDLVEREEAELSLIRQYMPEQLSKQELTELARKAIEYVNAVGPSDMGKVMAQLMPQVRGRSNGSEVSEVVQQILSQQG